MSIPFLGFAQSSSVEKFRNTNSPSMKLFFYESTLKMISRIDVAAISNTTGIDSQLGEIPDLTNLITGIEKVKFFMYEELAQGDVELFCPVFQSPALAIVTLAFLLFDSALCKTLCCDVVSPDSG